VFVLCFGVSMLRVFKKVRCNYFVKKKKKILVTNWFLTDTD